RPPHSPRRWSGRRPTGTAPRATSAPRWRWSAGASDRIRSLLGGEARDADLLDGPRPAIRADARCPLRAQAAGETHSKAGQEAIAGAGGVDLRGGKGLDVDLAVCGKQRGAARTVGDQQREPPPQGGNVEPGGLAAAGFEEIELGGCVGVRRPEQYFTIR